MEYALAEVTVGWSGDTVPVRSPTALPVLIGSSVPGIGSALQMRADMCPRFSA